MYRNVLMHVARMRMIVLVIYLFPPGRKSFLLAFHSDRKSRFQRQVQLA
jgi:hypothetical protein